MPEEGASSNAPVETPSAAGKLYDQCPVCGGGSLRDKYKVYGFTVTECTNCSLLFIREALTKEELFAHYNRPEATYIYDDKTNIENLKYYFEKIKTLIEASIPRGRILDVGCSAGIFLDVMTGWERHGVEVPSSAGMRAREKHGDNIFLGNFEDYSGGEHAFDCITFFDSFDHMRSPMEVLRKCNTLLKPGGLLILKVHDIGCLYAKLMGSSFYAIVPPSHLFYYTRKTLSYALTSSGFQVKRSMHLAHMILLKTIFFRLSRHNMKSIFYRIYEILDKKPLGNMRIKKNLHDVITLFATKQKDL